ncbi:3-hydroxyacyl-CoA dehydrogenase PaaH [Caenispirillum salinarum]|uniref:3-hydroxyacyl-CoA dehydrogenase PaaH n=1 Tax=Caenispirillum salinarum TaxID=859058 RepID=UPI00384EF738
MTDHTTATALPASAVVGVIGAGTMGAGIAQVAAAAGHPVVLLDAAPGAAAKGKEAVAKQLGKRVEKGRMTEADRDALLERITVVDALEGLSDAALVVEAIVERLDVKQEVFGTLEDLCGESVILASNTSSLSLTAIGAGLKRPERLVGMHFFNPAPVMQLVEVISGVATDPGVAATVHATAAAWGKSPVHARSTPGFIVNRVARPFYAESLRVLEEQAADVATIDAVMRECGGFRMGPFQLMDLIGHDVNYAVTSSVFAAYYNDKRFLPSLVQKDLVDAGWLGRKTGRGFYDYAEGAETPEPATAALASTPEGPVVCDAGAPLLDRLRANGIEVEVEEADDFSITVDGVVLLPSDGGTATEVAEAEGLTDVVVYDLALDYMQATRMAVAVADQAVPGTLEKAVGLLQAAGFTVSVIDDVPGLIVTRTVAMLANEAADAVFQGVAGAGDVDTAMTKGVNYPRGPLAWAEDLGLERLHATLTNLYETYHEDRYRPSPLLRRKVLGGTRFHA